MLFRQALERDLQQTQNVCIKLQTQGMYPEALKYMERCLTLTSETRTLPSIARRPLPTPGRDLRAYTKPQRALSQAQYRLLWHPGIRL